MTAKNAKNIAKDIPFLTHRSIPSQWDTDEHRAFWFSFLMI